MVKRNKELVAKGDRVFVICNGPSLLKTDIMKLTEEDTITVNNFYKQKEYLGFESKYHLAIDDAFASGSHHDFIIKTIKEHPSVVYIVSHKVYKTLPASPNIHGLYAKRVQYGKYVCCDFCSNMTAAINVSVMAIQVAISMGYRKIYLLGVDYNDFITAVMDKTTRHFYEEENAKGYDSVLNGTTLRWQYIAFAQHYALAKYAEKKGIIIENLSPGTCLDAYKRNGFEDVV